jgi:metal-sulfur cluster biosynthetic enzyme
VLKPVAWAVLLPALAFFRYTANLICSQLERRRKGMPTKEQVLEVLKNCYDPEIGINIVDLGLIYGVDIDEEAGRVKVTFTLTTPFCPLGPELVDQIRELVGSLEGVKEVETELTFDPPWSPEKATEEGKALLRIMGVPI